MSANQRGVLIFLMIVAVVAVLCFILPFVWLPSAGIAVALPVVQLPGEYYFKDWPSPDFEWTNTWMGTVLADVVLVLVVIFTWYKTKGWTNKVPGRWQGLMETLVNFPYNLVKRMAGTSQLARNQLFPLVASIFFFLLVANFLELIPGVDSIGLMHCAKEGKNGYARNDTSLYNEQPIFTGYAVESLLQYEMCEYYLEGKFTEPFAEASVEELEADLESAVADHDHFKELLSEARIENVETLETLAVALEDESLTEEARADLEEQLALAQTRTIYPAALRSLTDEQIEQGILPYGHIVTPFIRAAATDINLTFALALISFFAFQYFGLRALGTNYIQKFVNVGALGNLRKRPIGAMDFGVGLFEIISEISKIISLGFRLLGNVFAGQLLLFIMAFLVATLLPVIIYGLETIVLFMQAYVFAMLTLIFSAQAMEDHSHHDDDEDHH